MRHFSSLCNTSHPTWSTSSYLEYLVPPRTSHHSLFPLLNFPSFRCVFLPSLILLISPQAANISIMLNAYQESYLRYLKNKISLCHHLVRHYNRRIIPKCGWSLWFQRQDAPSRTLRSHLDSPPTFLRPKNSGLWSSGQDFWDFFHPRLKCLQTLGSLINLIPEGIGRGMPG